MIYDFIVCHQPNGQVSCNLKGLRASDHPPSTIPPETPSTSARPDIAIITPDCITLDELTFPWDSDDNLAQAKRRKSKKENYQLAFFDLANLGLSAKRLCMSLFVVILNIMLCSLDVNISFVRTNASDKLQEQR